MKLLTDKLRSELPPLYGQTGAEDPIVHIKFFTPDAGWTWFVTEGQEEEGEFIFFGVVRGHEVEWGYFTLSELESIRGPLGLPIERDIHFTPAPWSKVKERYRLE